MNYTQFPWWDYQQYQQTGMQQYQPYQQPVTTTSNITYGPIIDHQKMIEFLNFAFELLGIDMTYDKFITLTEGERKALIRDMKISKLIN